MSTDQKPAIVLAHPTTTAGDDVKLERTFALIKNGAIRRGHTGNIYAAADDAGLRIVESKWWGTEDETVYALRALAMFRGLYAEHAGKPFYDGLIGSVARGSLAMILEGEDAVKQWRALMGPTDPVKARQEAPTSLRALYGTTMPDNATHGSDSAESAEREIAIFFPEFVERRQPRGLWCQLTPEQRKAALAYTGPENHGDAAFLLPRVGA